MPTFVSLVNLTDQGVRGVKESPKRFKAFKKMAKKMGIEVKCFYYTQGQYDMVAILEGPDEAAMVALLNLSSLGNARFQTMRGYSVDEMNGFISKMQ